MLVAVLALALCGSTQPQPTPADKAISDATNLLEKALAEAKDPTEKAKLQAALLGLRKASAVPVVPVPQNDLITELIDNRKKFVGQTITLRLTYASGDKFSMRDHVGRTVVFTAVDPKSKAKLVIGVKLPNGLEVPAAKDGEEVIVTFTVDSLKENTATSVVRP